MPRKNIFTAKILTLDYNETKGQTDYGKCFVLKRDNNDSGRRYNKKEAKDLIITIQKEMEKPKHKMPYNLKKFNISVEAQKVFQGFEEAIKKGEEMLSPDSTLESKIYDN